MSGLLTGYLHRKRNAAVQRYLKGDVLDIGCGPAIVARWLDSSQRYVGVEMEPESMTHLRSKFPQHTFIQRDVDTETLSLGNSQFDTVLMVAVIEHLSTPDRLIKDARNYMKPNSRLVITTPTALGTTIHRVGARLGLFAHEAVIDHKYVYGRGSLTDLLGRCGMHVVLHRHFELGANQLCISTPLL